MTTHELQEHEMNPIDIDPVKLKVLIGKHVLDALGTPAGLLQVQIKGLWDNCYRANVLVGPDITSVRVAHSFFLMADGEGRIVASTPTIPKLY
jgi:hypothetical protein